MANSDLIIGLDLGGTRIKAAVIRKDGSVVSRAQAPTDAHQGPDHILNTLERLARDVTNAAGIKPESCLGVGVGTPGPMDCRPGVVKKATNLPGFANIPLQDQMSSRLQIDTIVSNDGCAAVYGEWWVGAGKGESDIVMLTLGTGVGGGIIVSNQLLTGHFANGAELGHIIIEAGGRPCACGQHGCLEQYASATALTRSANKAKPNGRGNNAELASAEDVAAAVVAGDQIAIDAWNECCRFLAIGIINIQRFIDPAVVILGGGLSQAGELLLSTVRAAVDAERWHLTDDVPRIVQTALDDDAGVLGAAGLLLASRQ